MIAFFPMEDLTKLRAMKDPVSSKSLFHLEFSAAFTLFSRRVHRGSREGINMISSNARKGARRALMIMSSHWLLLSSQAHDHTIMLLDVYYDMISVYYSLDKY